MTNRLKQLVERMKKSTTSLNERDAADVIEKLLALFDDYGQHHDGCNHETLRVCSCGMKQRYGAVLSMENICIICANGTNIPDGEECQGCGRVSDRPPPAHSPSTEEINSLAESVGKRFEPRPSMTETGTSNSPTVADAIRTAEPFVDRLARHRMENARTAHAILVALGRPLPIKSAEIMLVREVLDRRVPILPEVKE